MTDQAGDNEPNVEDDEPGIEDVGLLYRQSLILLSSVRDTLAEELARIASGDPVSLKGLTSKQSELEQALRRAFETEQKFHDWNAKRSTGHAAAEIDFDQVRYEIGCRLARLSSCCDSD